MRRDISGWTIRFDEDLGRDFRTRGIWRYRTIADDARAMAQSAPDRVCLRDNVRAITYSGILREAETLAASLWHMGLRPGQVISFQLPNWIEAAVINIAAALLGLIVNPIVPIYRNKETEDILRDCGARVLFVPEIWRNFDHAAMAERIAQTVPDLRYVVVRGGETGHLAAAVRYESLLAAGTANIPWPDQDPDALKFVMYTSGTTGRAKGVLHTHNTLARSLTGCMQFWEIDETDVILMPSPVSHVTGYLWGLEAPFCWGSQTLLMDRWDATGAIDLIDRHRVAMTVSATPFLRELLDAAEQRQTHLPSLKIFACGGASVPPDLIRRANAWLANGRAFRVYGATEVLMIGRGIVDAANPDAAADTDGKIVDFDVRFVDEQGHPVPDGAEGEILARGAGQFVGYVDPAETEKCFDADGYYRTGDLGLKTADGSIVIVGRKKDLIIRGGENLSAKEIEDILQRHPAIQEIAVVAMPHPRLGETVCAFVIPTKEKPTLADLVFCLEEIGIARQKFPERLELLEDFPRTPAGKVKKDILRALVAEKIRAESSGASFSQASS